MEDSLPVVRGLLTPPSLAAHSAAAHVRQYLMDFSVPPRLCTAASLTTLAHCVAAIDSLQLDGLGAPLPLGLAAHLVLLHSTTTANTATLKLLASGLLTVDLALYLAPHQPPPSDILITSLANRISSIISTLAAKSATIGSTESSTADLIDEVASSSSSLQVDDRPDCCSSDEDVAAEVCNSADCKLFPPIVRGGAFDPYVPTTDGLLVQYDFDALLCHQKTPYQDIKIFHSQQFGNTLLLDDDPNMAESDMVYTETMLGSNRYNFAASTVLILGGGDGGILNALLKAQPKSVVMIDLDEMVIAACRTHLRGVCGDALDSFKGPNHEIIINDCIPVLENFSRSGRKFDYVINDLTAVPVTKSREAASDWDFLKLVLELSFEVLEPHGRYFTQGNSFNMAASLALYEQLLRSLPYDVTFTKEIATVPSYHEQWVFYDVFKGDGKQIAA